MDLGDRGRRQRNIIEAREDLVRRSPQAFGQRCPRRLGRERRQPVAELGKVGGQGLAHEVGAGREELAELDEAGSERLEREREALALAQPREVGRGAPAKKSRHARHHQSEIEGL